MMPHRAHPVQSESQDFQAGAENSALSTRVGALSSLYADYTPKSVCQQIQDCERSFLPGLYNGALTRSGTQALTGAGDLARM